MSIEQDKFNLEVAKVNLMTNEQKGFLLLDSIRNISFQSGTSEGELIHLMVNCGGIFEGLGPAIEFANGKKRSSH